MISSLLNRDFKVFLISKGKGKKSKPNKKEYQSVNSDSENERYADDSFDAKNPFGDDEIESFHANSDKVIHRIF